MAHPSGWDIKYTFSLYYFEPYHRGIRYHTDTLAQHRLKNAQNSPTCHTAVPGPIARCAFIGGISRNALAPRAESCSIPAPGQKSPAAQNAAAASQRPWPTSPRARKQPSRPTWKLSTMRNNDKSPAGPATATTGIVSSGRRNRSPWTRTPASPTCCPSI